MFGGTLWKNHDEIGVHSLTLMSGGDDGDGDDCDGSQLISAVTPANLPDTLHCYLSTAVVARMPDIEDQGTGMPSSVVVSEAVAVPEDKINI